ESKPDRGSIGNDIARRNTTVSGGSNGSHPSRVSYNPKLKDIPSMVAGTTTGLLGSRMPALIVAESYHVLPQVLDRIRAEQPDYIVYGAMCAWARIVVQVLDIPAMTLRTTYVINEHASAMLMQQRDLSFSNVHEVKTNLNTLMSDLCKTYHVPSFDVTNMSAHDGQRSIVFIPKEFQPAGDSLDERYLFVGPSILPRQETNNFPLGKLSNERPILYISLGTVFSNQSEFFKMCFEAFDRQPWQAVLSGGRQVDPTTLGPVPDNFLISPYVPQLEILPRTQVFVTHAGMNSTMESLYHGVPMVAIPQMDEQAVTARRIAEMGLGIALEKETVNATTLREAVERVANEVAFRESVRNMQQITREAGGYGRAADAIMQFAEEHAEACSLRLPVNLLSPTKHELG
ncbi:MAG TPA: macrolide family glycosyltransferase, partial [Ktedonobacteraceae bacterium]|nr:macrolide family glycosyltransferase [Ktedonobacteraceae bacterium]